MLLLAVTNYAFNCKTNTFLMKPIVCGLLATSIANIRETFEFSRLHG